MEMPIMCFKVSQVEFYLIVMHCVPEVCFLSKQTVHGALCAISSGSSLFAKVPVYQYPVSMKRVNPQYPSYSPEFSASKQSSPFLFTSVQW